MEVLIKLVQKQNSAYILCFNPSTEGTDFIIFSRYGSRCLKELALHTKKKSPPWRTEERKLSPILK
jgi:hypothetical protein